MDPYSAVASNEAEDSANGNASYMISANAYDDDDDDDDVNRPINASYASDPTILASSAAGDFPEFEKIGPQIGEDDEGYGHSTYGQRMDYTHAQYQDLVFTMLWLAHFFAMFVALIYEWSVHDKSIIIGEANAGFLIVFVCAVIGTILGYIFTKIIRGYAGRIIKVMLFGNLFFLMLASFLYFVMLQMVTAILFSVFTFIFALYIWSIWKRIPFTETMINIACIIINAYPSVIVISMFILIMQILWILWWSALSVAYLSQTQWNNGTLLLLLISFYWNLEVFKNIGHTTVCGVAATWFFVDQQTITNQATLKSLKRAMTTSLGSIALGSLIVAFIAALRQLVVIIRKQTKHDLMQCILQCLLQCLQRLVQYFNFYAFCHVAIYGTNYIESARNSWSLLKRRGIDALINDDLTGFVILCGSLIGGIVCAIVGGIMGKIGTDAPHTYALMGFLVGFYLCLTILQTVTSCVITVFVCYAEDPHSLNVNHPAEYNKMERARANIGQIVEVEHETVETGPTV